MDAWVAFTIRKDDPSPMIRGLFDQSLWWQPLRPESDKVTPPTVTPTVNPNNSLPTAVPTPAPNIIRWKAIPLPETGNRRADEEGIVIEWNRVQKDYPIGLTKIPSRAPDLIPMFDITRNERRLRWAITAEYVPNASYLEVRLIDPLDTIIVVLLATSGVGQGTVNMDAILIGKYRLTVVSLNADSNGAVEERY